MNFTENDWKLLVLCAALRECQCRHDGLDENAKELRKLMDAVMSDRATSEQLSEICTDVEKVFGPMCERCGYATTHCKCLVASERAEATKPHGPKCGCAQTEPTATEPEVPDNSKAFGMCKTLLPAPDVPDEGEDTTALEAFGKYYQLRSGTTLGEIIDYHKMEWLAWQSCWNAATELGQAEITKLREVIDKYAEHEPWCDWEMSKAAGKNADPCDDKCGLDKAKRKAGRGQREAKGDGG